MNGRGVSTWYTGPVLFYASVPEMLDAKNVRFPSRFPDTFLCSFLPKILNPTSTVTEIDRSLKRMLFYILHTHNVLQHVILNVTEKRTHKMLVHSARNASVTLLLPQTCIPALNVSKSVVTSLLVVYNFPLVTRH